VEVVRVARGTQQRIAVVSAREKEGGGVRAVVGLLSVRHSQVFAVKGKWPARHA
jgi:hypothetical protein